MRFRIESLGFPTVALRVSPFVASFQTRLGPGGVESLSLIVFGPLTLSCAGFRSCLIPYAKTEALNLITGLGV